MAFDHHKLDVYQCALDALDACDRVTAQLPKGRGHIRDQLDRASGSIVANIAEGAGEFTPREKARFYRIARRSAIEAVAWLEVIERRGEAPQALLRAALGYLERVVSVLVKLIRPRSR